MFIVRNRNWFFLLPGALVALSIAAIFFYGLTFGIDFTGGSLLEVSFAGGRPSNESVKEAAGRVALGVVAVQPSGEDSYIIRARDVSEEEHQALLQSLAGAKEERFTSIGPTIGKELRNKAWIAIGVVVLTIMAYIAFAFRRVSRPVSSWKYSVVTIVTLVHDVLIPTGLFAMLGYFRGAEVDSLFVVALLTILGISINDTIVVFDRIRENIKKNQEGHRSEEFESVVGRSLDQTILRSFNTSLTVIFVLLALFFFGPESTKNFALTLTVGMIAGTYSSIFLASPLLVVWERWQRAGR